MIATKTRNFAAAELIATPPAALGYRMPAEWEPHAATWIAWPHNREDWPDKFEPIPWVYAEIVRHLSRVERVEILVRHAEAEADVREILIRANVLPQSAAKVGSPSGNVRFHEIPTNRVWTRDYGPIFIRRDEPRSNRNETRRLGANDGRPATAKNSASLPPVAATAWCFNAWAKYNDWQLDAPVSSEIASELKLPVWKPLVRRDGKPNRLVLEGGSIDVNGRGTLLTTEECLLSDIQQRNPGISRQQLEDVFRDYLGIRKVIWLERGIVGDDTHGHVDDISRFVAPNTIVTAYEPDRADENHEILRENFRKLSRSTDQSGKPLRVVKLPMPAPVIFRRQRLPASYANFYIANKLVLVPVFNDANDRLALNTLAELFPGRAVIGIYCGDFIWGLGALHCMTQQQPA